MVPVRRHAVNKRRSVKRFRRHTLKTKSVNMTTGFARGGIRL